jgi:superfamily II DNA or RNA helicase
MVLNDVLMNLRRSTPESLLDQMDLAGIAAGRSTPPLVVEGLERLRDTTGARTVGELARMPNAERALGTFARSERRAFVSAFAQTIRRIANELRGRESDGGASAAAPAAFDARVVPRGGAALEEWAAHFHVESTLDAAVQVAIGTKGDPDKRLLSIRQLSDLDVHPELGRAWNVARQTLRFLGEQRLKQAALQNAPLLEDRDSFLARRRAPDDRWIGERIGRLQAAVQAMTDVRDAIGLVDMYPASRVTFAAAPARLAVSIGFGQGSHTIDLATGSIKPIAGHWYAPRHVARSEERKALLCAIDALCDPDGTALRDCMAWRSTPAWSHMLRAFEAGVQQARLRLADEAERVAFRLRLDGGLPEVLVQRARKGGSFTPGRQDTAFSALGLEGLSSLEREILQYLSVLEGHQEYPASRPRLRLFELLAEHPRVHLASDPRVAVELRASRPVLRIARDAGQEAVYVASIAFGQRAVSPVEAVSALGGDGIFLVPDERARAAYFGEMDAVAASLLHALSAYPDALPAEGLDALLQVLQSFPNLELGLDLPEEARGTPVVGDGRLIARLAMLPGGGLGLSVRLRPLPGMPVLLPGTAPRHVYGRRDDGARIFVTRDLDDEEARAERLLAELPLADSVRKGPFDVRIPDGDRACDLLATLAELGEGVVSEWEDGARVRVAATVTRRSLRIRIEKKRDWFGVEGGAEVEGQTIGLEALLAAARRGRRFVRLDSGALVALGRELREQLARADDMLHEAPGGLAAHPPALGAIADLVEDESEQLVAAKEWIQLRARIRAAEALEPELPAGLRAELRPYQQQGYRWLMRLAACGVGGCLADDMGLGKTLQALAVLEARKGAGPALVVSPTSVCAVWASEAARFAPGLEFVLYRGAGRQEGLERLGAGSVLVMSYDVLLRDVAAIEPLAFATLVFDEAHALKNPQSKRAAAARRLRAEVRLALTGTPVENHLGELWSLFRVAVPGLFGPWERFRERFAGPIERDRDASRRAALARLVRPYLLRRTKAEVSPELPPRTDVVRFVDLSRPERALYEAERLRAIESMREAGEDQRFAMLAALTRLRQLACHPRLRDENATVPSSKLASFLSLVGELRAAGHRALVFSQFTTHLALVAAALRQSGVPFDELDGSTPAEVRADRIARFQAGQGDLFLISLKAGGTGINLTAADYVLHLDPWWNPAAEDQASDRAHRIGQQKPVTVVRFISRGTIEEAVLALHGEKRELAQSILEGGDVAGRLTTRELLALMSTSAEREPEGDTDPEDVEDD